MEGYDREFTTIINWRAQLRVGFSTDRGELTTFFVQLEYWLDGEWNEVVRFDHDPTNPMAHDIATEGLHMDVYRDGSKYRVKSDFPPVELTRAVRYCTTYIEKHTEYLIRRDERWHNVNETDR